MTTLGAVKLELLVSCEYLEPQVLPSVFNVWAYFPKGFPAVDVWAEDAAILLSVICFGIYSFKCLSSPVGLLSLSASEPLQSVCSTAVSKDSFFTTHSSKASKDCPVGFADIGSVSVVC